MTRHFDYVMWAHREETRWEKFVWWFKGLFGIKKPEPWENIVFSPVKPTKMYLWNEPEER